MESVWSHIFVLVCFVLVCLLSAEGKDGNPMGVVWRGGVHIVCSTEAQENEIAYYLSPHSYLSHIRRPALRPTRVTTRRGVIRITRSEQRQATPRDPARDCSAETRPTSVRQRHRGNDRIRLEALANSARQRHREIRLETSVKRLGRGSLERYQIADALHKSSGRL
jgi:hypothetical protein